MELVTEEHGVSSRGLLDEERHRRLVDERRAARVRALLAPGSRTAHHFVGTALRPSFFPIDPSYRVPVRLEPAVAGAQTRRDRVNGETEDFPIVGLLRGSVDGQPFALEAARMPDGTIQWDHFLKTPEDRRQRQAEYTRSCERLGIIPPALSFVVRRVTTVAEGNVPVGDNEVFAD